MRAGMEAVISAVENSQRATERLHLDMEKLGRDILQRDIRIVTEAGYNVPHVEGPAIAGKE